jgi:hypothetical protein
VAAAVKRQALRRRAIEFIMADGCGEGVLPFYIDVA